MVIRSNTRSDVCVRLRCRLCFLLLTVMASVGHGWVVLEMSVLVLRHCGGEAAVSAPAGVWICGGNQISGSQMSLRLEQSTTSDRCGGWWRYSLEGPALMVEKADVEAELLASDGGSREGLLKGSCGPGLDGGCWIVGMWPSELE